MMKLVREREIAYALRRKGYTYKEILAELPVAKSSISLWLKDLPLTKAEKKVLRRKREEKISRGRIRASATHRKNRQVRERALFVEAQEVFSRFKDEALFHTGIAIYWAEGSKRNSTFLFMNSDAEMVDVLLRWLERYTEFNRQSIGYRLYLHAPYQHEDWEDWWAQELGVSRDQFKKTIVKPTGLKVKKRPNYRGCLRVEVPRSTKLLVMMKMWTRLLVEYHRKAL